MPYRLSTLGFAALMLLAVAGCERVEQVRESFIHLTPHDQYAASLAEAGLAETALGRAWTAASTETLEGADAVDLPLREARYLDPAQPSAIGYRFDLQRGQKLMIDVDAQMEDSAHIFIDLFVAPRDSTDDPRHLRSADSTRTLTYTVRRDRSYLLRIQPELLHGGRLTVTVQTDASLAFPVADRDTDAIRSVFGAPRDGGRRRHHGVDIFAPRGTPALAAADAYVTRVRTGGLGGKTVWLRDADGHALYYAHLDSQMVRRGMRVSAGDTVGLVGNTGNARTTPPHLHFGIYQNGPTDPFPFLHRPRVRPADVRVDTGRLGRTTRVTQAGTRLRTAPSIRADVRATLPRHTALYVDGGRGGWYRVRLPDRTAGYLAAAQLESASRPVRALQLAAGQPVRHRPVAEAAAIDSLPAGAAVAVLGQYDDFLFVEAAQGRTGWIAAP